MRKIVSIATLLVVICAIFTTGCKESNEVKITNQTVAVACGACIYKMEEAQGCEWAAEVNGEHMMVQGTLPLQHNSHGPDGMCNMERQAKIEGVVRDGKLITSSFELLPPTDVPESPAYTPADQH